jgi:short-subunit dehydrogenase
MTQTLKPLDQQAIVITGASSGIGLATALCAAERGAKVVAAGRSARTPARLARSIESAGGHAIPVVADVGNRNQVQQIADEAVRHFGRIDTWVNNAGIAIYGQIAEVSDADNRRLFDTNFWGVVYGSLIALPYLETTGGALINVGSEVSEAVVPLLGMYAASKHAVKGLTDALRIELQEAGSPVSVTLIQPTAVDKPFPEHARNYMDHEPKLPTPRIEPMQVAQAILEAATAPRRDIKVGLMAKVNTAAFKFAPALADWMAGQQQDRQQYEAAPIDPKGALYRPSETGRVHGRRPAMRVESRPAGTGEMREGPVSAKQRGAARQTGGCASQTNRTTGDI